MERTPKCHADAEEPRSSNGVVLTLCFAPDRSVYVNASQGCGGPDSYLRARPVSCQTGIQSGNLRMKKKQSRVDNIIVSLNFEKFSIENSYKDALNVYN